MNNLAEIGKTADGKALLDVQTLITSRLLCQSNSGGGKSYLLRKVLEETHDKVQQIVFDVEGEFKSLREKYDYVLVGKDGDIPISIKTAAILPRKILELGVSVIIDMSELKFHERILFVKRFLVALMELPQEYWRPLLVVIDEAHLYCPQTGNVESAPAVIDLCTRGRKRGFCAVLATQRLSKLHKDAAAELLNKLIGRTGLDIDMKRAADELGFSTKEQMRELRDLDAGEFFAFGAAISRSVVKVKIGKVNTTHPKAGAQGLVKTPPATEKVKEALRKLADLSLEAEKELNTLDDYKREVSDLRRQLTVSKRGQPLQTKTEVKVVRDERREAALKAEVADSRSRLAAAERMLVELKGAIAQRDKTLKRIGELVSAPQRVSFTELPRPTEKKVVVAEKPVRAQVIPKERSLVVSDGEITKPQQRILESLAKLYAAQLEQVTKPMLAAFCQVRPTSGSYANNLGSLRSRGLIDYPAGNMVALTESGLQAVDVPASPPSDEEMQQHWFAIMSGPQQRIMEVLIERYPQSITKEELAEIVSVSPTSGSFANNLGSLRTMGALDYPIKGSAAASKNLFVESN